MVWIGGADACRLGWFRACRETASRQVHFGVFECVADLLSSWPQPDMLAIDIPIGLPDSGARECDRMARRCLGWPRRNSVFPAPIRRAINATSQSEASGITLAIDGRMVSAQAFGLFPKIREVDALLRTSAEARSRIREIHPEISFWSWTDGKAIVESKKTPAGKAKRQALAEQWLGPEVMDSARGRHLKKHVADDDILDAIAALWTAARIERSEAATLPGNPPTDSAGLRMEIVY
ncbi:MAG: DUF429 domain-containing protein [Pseudomonadota bacterium]